MIKNLVQYSQQAAKVLQKLIPRQRKPVKEEVCEQFLKSDEFTKIYQLVQSIGVQDFNIQNNDYFFQKNIISYTKIYECIKQNYSIGIYYIPQGFQMPIHDHPNMFVLSKVLLGSAERVKITYPRCPLEQQKQYDFPMGIYFPEELKKNYCEISQKIQSQQQNKATQNQTNNLKSQQNQKNNFIDLHQIIEDEKDLNYLKSDIIKGCEIQNEIIKTNNVELVQPNIHNLHGFTACENFAFIDVLLPTYDFANNFCNFYDIVSVDGNYCSLKIQGFPENYCTRTVHLNLKY